MLTPFASMWARMLQSIGAELCSEPTQRRQGHRSLTCQTDVMLLAGINHVAIMTSDTDRLTLNPPGPPSLRYHAA